MEAAQEPAATLERRYRRILAERMADLPFLNPHLSVRAIGFQPWNGDLLGVMLTPWFMNLMLLPGPQGWSGRTAGQQLLQSFPSGDYRFTVGAEPDIGVYQMCSLFSPALQFPDQETAEAVARQILLDLLRAPESAGISRRRLLQGRFRDHGGSAG